MRITNNELKPQRTRCCGAQGRFDVRLKLRQNAVLRLRGEGHNRVEWSGVCAAANEGSGEEPSSEEVRAGLNNLMRREDESITGAELRALVFQKWGKSYEVRLSKRMGAMFLEVMWKHLEQASFHLSPEEYDEQCGAVAEFLTEWGVVEQAKMGILKASSRGPGMTGGRAANAITVRLDVAPEFKDRW